MCVPVSCAWTAFTAARGDATKSSAFAFAILDFVLPQPSWVSFVLAFTYKILYIPYGKNRSQTTRRAHAPATKWLVFVGFQTGQFFNALLCVWEALPHGPSQPASLAHVIVNAIFSCERSNCSPRRVAWGALLPGRNGYCVRTGRAQLVAAMLA